MQAFNSAGLSELSIYPKGTIKFTTKGLLTAVYTYRFQQPFVSRERKKSKRFWSTISRRQLDMHIVNKVTLPLRLCCWLNPSFSAKKDNPHTLTHTAAMNSFISASWSASTSIHFIFMKMEKERMRLYFLSFYRCYVLYLRYFNKKYVNETFWVCSESIPDKPTEE